jgi:L-alanine-DL-glutamate epimerase-like enolase superfamily enzyme
MKGKQMRITSFQTWLVSYTHPEKDTWWGGSWEQVSKGVRFNGILLRVHTDEGISGLGEASPWGDCRATEAMLHRLEQRFVGRDPFDVEKLTVHTADGAINSALAAIDVALWDIVGKATHTPCYRLLARDGDFQATHLRTYASGGVAYHWDKRPEAVVEEALRHQAAGFTAFKMRIGSAWGPSGVTVARFGELLRQVRAAIGDEMELMLDANNRFRTFEEALQVCRLLEEVHARWFEEPFSPFKEGGPEAYAALRQRTTVPISGGEVIHDMAAHQRMLNTGAYGIIQPDCTFVGMTAAYRVALLYHQHGLPCIPHSWTNAIAHAANAHLVAAIPNRVMLETQQIHNPMLTDIVDRPIPVQQGYVDVPDRPGLGIELDEDALKRYPFTENGIAIPWP